MSGPLIPEFFSADSSSFRPSAIRAFAHLINDPRIISFAGGLPSPATFPAGMIAEVAADVLRERKEVALQYGPTAGLPRLRGAISSIASARGIRCTAESVLISTGSQQALHLVATVLLDPGDVVLVELPAYVGGLSAFYGRSAQLVGVRQDEDGIDPADLRSKAAQVRREGKRLKALYTIPNFQNPSGRLLSAARRAEVLAIAWEERFLIIEDDPYGELRFDESAVTRPIAADDPELEHVIYLGSFSKVLAPGLRCGFVVAAAPILQRVQLAKEAADLCSGMLDQCIVDEICERDLLRDQIARVRSFYEERAAALLTALETSFAGRAKWTDVRGGLFTFLTLDDESIDTRALVPRAVEAGVIFVPGSAFFVDGSGANAMRLTFAKEPDDRMREGIARLARLIS
ncbi:MAG TPA: PLP-dependent aminotransferase family protein [Thermoanaerobaculia bacterium]|nr:PLP-dependent aminotransferase family protein [Thermoanaerobaculia bacterium]